MTVERDSAAYRILEKLCAMPAPVRGMTGTRLDAAFGAPEAVDRLAAEGLIRRRGWHDGPPGAVWVPTAAGEALYRELAAEARADTHATPF
jgi:hypothetical protein